MWEQVKTILIDTLKPGAPAASWTRDTPLLGSLPELDSMAVINVIGAIEERFGFTVDDDEISADVFGTIGTLADFIEDKVRGRTS